MLTKCKNFYLITFLFNYIDSRKTQLIRLIGEQKEIKKGMIFVLSFLKLF